MLKYQKSAKKRFWNLFFEVDIWYQKTFQFVLGRFFKKDKVSSSINMTALSIEPVKKEIKSKRKFCRQ